MFKGSIVALVTPMHEDGSLDKKALEALVEWHIQCKTDAIVVAGTTGESATLDPDEHFTTISTVVKQAAGRIPIIAGAGTNATQTTIMLAHHAYHAKADACLIVTPYYNKPTQAGLYQHYRTIAEKTALPIILYNVPSRTGCDLLPETVAKLSQLKQIIGIKEATGKLDRAQALSICCEKNFAIYSGDDATALDLLLQQAKGVISVTANVAPDKMHALYQAAYSGNHAIAKKIDNELQLLHTRLFIESNPIPTKWALQIMGKIKGGIRLPLLSLDKQYHHAVKEALQKAGIAHDIK